MRGRLDPPSGSANRMADARVGTMRTDDEDAARLQVTEQERRRRDELLDELRSRAEADQQREREALVARIRTRTGVGTLPDAPPASALPAAVVVGAAAVACAVGGWVAFGVVGDRSLVLRVAALVPPLAGLAFFAWTARGARTRRLPALLLTLAAGAAASVVVTVLLNLIPPTLPQLRAARDQAGLPFLPVGDATVAGDRLCWSSCVVLTEVYRVEPPHPHPEQPVLEALERNGWTMGSASHNSARQRGNVRADVSLVPGRPDLVEVSFGPLPTWAR
jgi:hypothetical protein